MSASFTTNPFQGMSKATEVAPTGDRNARPEYVEPEQSSDTESSVEEVPTGTTKEILEWVGDDKDRAQRALDAEQAKGDEGLKGLQRELKKMLED